ncbi:uncharacterized protein [Clytia hemisphaerica]|uniref:uncharacterized protein n=1 Tax=Clytia hemisphaerica TaxID=252671 RepID=UPI0034D3EEBB
MFGQLIKLEFEDGQCSTLKFQGEQSFPKHYSEIRSIMSQIFRTKCEQGTTTTTTQTTATTTPTKATTTLTKTTTTTNQNTTKTNDSTAQTLTTKLFYSKTTNRQHSTKQLSLKQTHATTNETHYIAIGFGLLFLTIVLIVAIKIRKRVRDRKLETEAHQTGQGGSRDEPHTQMLTLGRSAEYYLNTMSHQKSLENNENITAKLSTLQNNVANLVSYQNIPLPFEESTYDYMSESFDKNLSGEADDEKYIKPENFTTLEPYTPLAGFHVNQYQTHQGDAGDYTNDEKYIKPENFTTLEPYTPLAVFQADQYQTHQGDAGDYNNDEKYIKPENFTTLEPYTPLAVFQVDQYQTHQGDAGDYTNDEKYIKPENFTTLEPYTPLAGFQVDQYQTHQGDAGDYTNDAQYLDLPELSDYELIYKKPNTGNPSYTNLHKLKK